MTTGHPNGNILEAVGNEGKEQSKMSVLEKEKMGKKSSYKANKEELARRGTLGPPLAAPKLSGPCLPDTRMLPASCGVEPSLT